jgi:hypothetical protein
MVKAHSDAVDAVRDLVEQLLQANYEKEEVSA